ncbi:cysteine peptidase family C39 domain-containing protein [Aliifodinibius salicampi]|uniref:Cysteine peptidase family C39 domain-containing protein n=2 Tax=Fodinibius salicampi TaxID=1920655 RepID=A0ABT3PWP4_9BACT|nr:cysteine peptidase family C39 domain-containing protein [Fodinibius salicampi]
MNRSPTCLCMVARHHGRSYTMETLRGRSGIYREGVSLLGICEAAESWTISGL